MRQQMRQSFVTVISIKKTLCFKKTFWKHSKLNLNMNLTFCLHYASEDGQNWRINNRLGTVLGEQRTWLQNIAPHRGSNP